MKKLKLLHPAPELCFYEIFRKLEHIEYYPSDINEKGLLNIDLTNIKFPDNFFDFIICNHVLEHIPDDKKALKELYRVLNNNGTAIIMVPINEKFSKTFEDENIINPKDREKYFGQWDHVRWYGIDILDRVKDVGFKAKMIKYGKEFNNYIYNQYGLCDDFIIIANK